MNLTEANDLIAAMCVVWPQTEMGPEHTRAWRTSLIPFPLPAASQALEWLKGSSTFFPSHAEFTAKAAEAASRTRGLPSGSSKACTSCGGSGWRQVEVASGAEAYARCSCRPTPAAEHRSGCSCSACAYGPVRVGAIKAGTDGSGEHSGVDPLAARPQETYSPGQS